MKTNLSERVIAGIMILMLANLLCCLGVRIQRAIWDSGIQRAASKVNAEPTINGIAEYITSEIQVGMPRYEVEQILQRIAPIKVIPSHLLKDVGSGYGPTSCDDINLRFTIFPGHVWRIIACYNAQDQLVILRSADLDGFPELGIYEEPTQEGKLFESP